MEKIEYINISDVKVGDTIIFVKQPIGNRYGARYKVISQSSMLIVLNKVGDEVKIIYKFKKHFPKVYKVTEQPTEYIIWDDYTDDFFNSFGCREEAEVYLDELEGEGYQKSDFSIITQEEYEEYLKEKEDE